MGGASFADALNLLWVKYLPQIQERVGTIEEAAAALKARTLSMELQKVAHNEAHKLAGVLGTFGLEAGTELAREAELAFASDVPASPEAAPRLDAITAELKTMIAARS